MTFAEYFLVLQRRWRVWTSCLVLGVLAAAAVCILSPVRYTATATSFVTVAERQEDQGEIFQGSQFAVQRVKSYAPLAKSARVLESVIDEGGLDLSLRELADRISVESPPETVLLAVSVTDSSPARAARLADAVSERLGEVIEELETASASQVSNVRVSLAEPATVPTRPSSPRVVLNLLLGAVGGLALGLALAVLRHYSDRRVKTADDVRAHTGVSPLGAVPHDPDAAKRPLVALNWRSPSAERFRTVRTALKFASVDRGLRHFVVTSAIAGEGKSSTASNLAISWAQTGASVCVVEADLRRPSASAYFGVDGSLGLSDVLVGDRELDEVLVDWNDRMLTLLPAGSLPPDPAALLGSDAMHTLVRTLHDRFDVVIYDSPPVLAVADGIVLAEQVDGVVLVARSGVVRVEQLASAIEELRKARLTLLGTVLNGERHRFGPSYEYTGQPSASRAELAPLLDAPLESPQRAAVGRQAETWAGDTGETADTEDTGDTGDTGKAADVTASDEADEAPEPAEAGAQAQDGAETGEERDDGDPGDGAPGDGDAADEPTAAEVDDGPAAEPEPTVEPSEPIAESEPTAEPAASRGR